MVGNLKRPEGADLRSKMGRPDEELDFLYAEEKKMSGRKTKSVESLIAVEKYIIYLEKRVRNLDEQLQPKE
jgi:hypothetical protein